MVRKKGLLAVMVFVILIGFGELGNNAAAGWVTKKVADGLKKGCVYQRGVVVDDYGQPHIAFGGGCLYYIYYDGNNWCPDPAESISPSSFEVNYVSMARDLENNMHISYFDAGNQDLWYATTNALGLWQPVNLNTTLSGGEYVSIAIDSGNKVHISYYDAGSQDLRYVTTNASGGWKQPEPIDKNGNTGKYTSIAVDSSNKVHISYYDDSNQDLKYITGSSSFWQTETVDSNGSVGEYTSLALDSNNKVHVSYYDAGNHDLRYATNASGSWQKEIVDGSGFVGEYTSLALDSLDNVHISYYDAESHDLKYAGGVSGSWQIETVDSGGDVGKYTSIAVCSFNKVHISYYDVDNQDLKYAAKSISIDNRPPEFLTIGPQTITEGVVPEFTINEEVLLEFTVTAIDPDVDDILTYAVGYPLPNGASFDSNTRTFSWTPHYGDAGSYKVTFIITDNGEPPINVSKKVNITVGNLNHQPEFDQIEDLTVNEGELLEFTIVATDQDEDNLTYSLDSTLPAGADFDLNTRTFKWTPGYDYVSNKDSREIELRFKVDDGEEYDSLVVTITINDVNQPPVFDQIEDWEVAINEGELLEFTIEATDPDEDNLIYSVDPEPPAGADFDPNTGIFSWKPGYDYVSNKNSKEIKREFRVNDGQYWDFMNMTITIYDVNQPPVLQIEAQTVKQGELLEFTIEAIDPDEDNLTYSVNSPLPNGASFDPDTQIFSWATEYGDADSYEVTFIVTDDGDTFLSDSEMVLITVTLQPNCKPYTPTLSYPDSNQCDVSLTPELQTGGFSDPDVDINDDTHSQTQWRIFRKDSNLCILDIISTSCLTKLEVAESILDEGISYYWQARFYDNQSTASDWSNRYSFTTSFDNYNDTDLNGVPDDQEESFEIDDMDNDNVSDRQQSDIKCVNTEVGNGQIGLSIKDSPDVISIESIKSIDPTAISGINKPDNMPLGLISFKVKVNTIGDSAHVTIYLSPPAQDGAKWYKYDPINGWRVYPYAVFSDDGTSVTLQLKDGDMEYGDVDGTENGIIVDPSGLGISSIPDTQDTQEEGITSVEGGGCFIAATAYRVSKIIVSKFLPEK